VQRGEALAQLAGDTLSGEVPTYRGEGRTFL
jgi:hypothetical protein